MLREERQGGILINNDIKQINTMQVLLLHLLPGLPVLFVAFTLSSPFFGIRLPFVLSIYLSIAFGLIPSEFLILRYVAKHNGKKIREIISYTEKMSISKTILWALPLLTVLGIAFSTIPELEKFLWTMFNWIPGWFRIDVGIIREQPIIVWLTIVLAFIFNGLLGPITEEIYFRGFLLPRMNKLGKLAPFINVFLFSLYHFFAPWENITRILGTLPYVYVVWYKRNLYIGIIVHCLGNLIGIIFTAVFLLST